MHRNLKLVVGIFVISVIFAGCGGDSSSSKGSGETEGIASVEAFDDLPNCTKSRYSEIVFVKEENIYFECTSEDWTEADPLKVDSLLSARSSSSSEKGSPQSSNSLSASSSDTAEVKTQKVDSVTVSGHAQKGPFASGSAVTVYGLDSLLEKTKTKFTGKVAGDSGAYSVSKIVLPSQFALIEVSGFYQNEASGKKTSGTKTTLEAVVDLSAGKAVTANVNLFTDLEASRVRILVLKEKFNVPAAKKRATRELLAAFSFGKSAESAGPTATEISLSDTTDAGRILLAASVLLQGDLSASKLGRRIEDIAERFAETGALDDAETLTAMADWASRADSTDNFAAIRENVKAMKLAPAVPDFESALYAFWTKEYGLGACTDSLESTIKKNENKLSDNYGAGYACTAKRWHKATALDTELGLCTGKTEGSFKEYKGAKATEYYVCRTGTWQQITETQYELKECTEKREGEYVAAKSGEYFVCTGKQWQELDAVTYELKLCTEKRENELATAKNSDNANGDYVCEWDGEKGEWRKATELESDIGVCGSKANLDSTIKVAASGDGYACLGGEWNKLDAVTAKLGFCTASLKDSVLWTGDFTDGRPDESTAGNYYACDGTEWNETTKLHYAFGATCDVFKDRIQRMYLKYLVKIPDYNVENNIVEDGSIAGIGNYVGIFNPAWKGYVDMWTYRDTVYSRVLCKDDRYTLTSAGVTDMRKFCTKDNLGDRGRARNLGRTVYSNNYYVCYQKGDGSYEWGRGLLDARDSAIYRIVTIGDQTWMAENLNYAYTGIPYIGSYTSDSTSWCYKDDPANCDTYGRLYTWASAMDSAGTWSTSGKGCGYGSTCTPAYPVRGVCPEGWHLPTKSEFETLFTAVGGISTAGTMLKSTSGWYNSGNGTDAYGFSALPAGDRIIDGSFDGQGFVAYFWSSTESGSNDTYSMELDYGGDNVFLFYKYNIKNLARSVRCLKDE